MAEKTVFYKSDLLKSKKYRENRDVLTVILEDNKPYTMEEVDKALKSFLKKEVK